MEVTMEELGKLKRKLTVEVPLNEVAAAYDEVYQRIRTNIRVDGFRPGKYPRHLAEKRFKELMGQEALQNLMPRYLEQVLQEKRLRPATEPQFHNLDIDKSRPFRFDVEFEIIPEFELIEAKAFTVEEKKVELEADAVERRIDELRASSASLEEKSVPAAQGDFVTFDFEGTLNGRAFAGGSGTSQQAELGAGRYLEGFEKELLGLSAGEHKKFTLTFPADYPQADLAGQIAEFKVAVRKVEAKKLPELDAAFFSQFGSLNSLEVFRDYVESRLRAEQEQAIEREYQEELAEQIRRRYDFDVPETLIEQAVADFEHHQRENHPEMLENPAKLEEAKAEEARNRSAELRLRYVLQRYAREYGITVSGEEVRSRFLLQAILLRQNPEELIRTRAGDMLIYQIQDQLLATKTLRRMVDLILGRPSKSEPAPPPVGTASAQSAPARSAQSEQSGEPPGPSGEAPQEDGAAAEEGPGSEA
jgi:trigger factor